MRLGELDGIQLSKPYQSIQRFFLESVPIDLKCSRDLQETTGKQQQKQL